jgi:mycoredoxin
MTFVMLVRIPGETGRGIMVMTEQIKIYGTKWCPDCFRAKQVFSKHDIPFVWFDIEQDEAACAFVEKANGGFKSVPTIVFPDGSVLVEPGPGGSE